MLNMYDGLLPTSVYVGEAKQSSNTPLKWRDNWPQLMPLWGGQLPCVPMSVVMGVRVQLYYLVCAMWGILANMPPVAAYLRIASNAGFKWLFYPTPTHA